MSRGLSCAETSAQGGIYECDLDEVDGSYSYELVVVPRVSRAVQQAMSDARESGDASAEVQVDSWLGEPLVQSGNFWIQNGSVVGSDGGAEEPAASKPVVDGPLQSESSDVMSDQVILDDVMGDQVILDDLIVDGSICVGMDCVNGESFGFDTIRLKENNLRIRFVDTSSTSSFPSRDWQITVNDSANGGLNKFSIDDIDGGRTPFTIEGNAPSHSLYVDDGGRLGLGTSTPVVDVHIKTGNTPTLRLEQDGSSGFTPQTWDVAGNEANFFIRDATNGSTLPFRIRPGAPSSSIDIANDGDVGVGTDSPEAKLHVKTTASGWQYGLKVESTSGSGVGFSVINGSYAIDFNNSGDEFRINHVDGDGKELSLNADGDLTVTGDFISGSTTLTVPDFVFEPGYRLMPLDELGAFVRREGHLPGIPSGEEFRASGQINLTEFPMRLLQKIEELTLHTLAQEKELSELRARLEALEGSKEH